VRRFAREARVLAALDHPGCVRVLDYATGDGVPYLVMELVKGRPLDRVIGPAGLPPRHAVHVAAQIADAIEAAHRAGIVHRDLKPENAILDVREGELRVRLIDFGLATVPPEEGASTTRLTRDGFLMGTPEYMAPEQILGREADGRTDLYALGVMLFELLTGAPPFTGSEPSTTVTLHLEREPPPPSLPGGLDPEAAAALRAHVAALLEKLPEDRPRSADEVARALRGLERRLPDAGPASGLLRAPPRGDGAAPTETLGDTTEEAPGPSHRARLQHETRNEPPNDVAGSPEARDLPAVHRDPGPKDRGARPAGTSEDLFRGLAGDAEADALLETELSGRRRARRLRLVLAAVGLLVVAAVAIPLGMQWLRPPAQLAASPEPALAPARRERVDLEPRTTPSAVDPAPADTLPTAGLVDLPGGERQAEYEAALRSLQSELSRRGLRTRDLRAHPRAARAWRRQSRAARAQRYPEALEALGEVTALARETSAREWMVHRLQRAERRLGDSPTSEARARVRALWRTLDRSSARPAEVRRFMERLDELEAHR
jgi:hypothetical protein